MVKRAETVRSTSASGVQSCAQVNIDLRSALSLWPVASLMGSRHVIPILRDCYSGNLRRVLVVASTAAFGPSALMESMGPITDHGFEHGEEKFLYAAVHRGWED